MGNSRVKLQNKKSPYRNSDTVAGNRKDGRKRRNYEVRDNTSTPTFPQDNSLRSVDQDGKEQTERSRRTGRDQTGR